MDLRHPVAFSLLNDLLSGDSVVRFTVTGDSMKPTLVGGDTVLLQQVTPGKVRLGDLLLCQAKETEGVQMLLHRVVAIRRRPGQPAQFQTQGDALVCPDEPINGEQILGRVCAIGSTRDIDLNTRIQRILALFIVLKLRGIWFLRRAYGRVKRLFSIRNLRGLSFWGKRQ